MFYETDLYIAISGEHIITVNFYSAWELWTSYEFHDNRRTHREQSKQ